MRKSTSSELDTTAGTQVRLHLMARLIRAEKQKSHRGWESKPNTKSFDGKVSGASASRVQCGSDLLMSYGRIETGTERVL